MVYCIVMLYSLLLFSNKTDFNFLTILLSINGYKTTACYLFSLLHSVNLIVKHDNNINDQLNFQYSVNINNQFIQKLNNQCNNKRTINLTIRVRII
jgi:hypothetical protein